MAMEIVDLSINHGESFHSYAMLCKRLPEGNSLHESVTQRSFSAIRILAVSLGDLARDQQGPRFSRIKTLRSKYLVHWKKMAKNRDT